MLADVSPWRWYSVSAVAIGATVLWVLTYAAGGDVVAVLPVGVMLVASILYVHWKALTGKHWALLLIMAVVVFLLSVTFHTREIGEPGLGWQNGMKLLAWTGMLAVFVPNASRLLRLLADPIILAFSCYCIICVISAAYSPVPLVTLTAGVGMLAYLSFSCVLAFEMSERTLFQVLLWVLAALCVINVISVLVVPDVAYFHTDVIGDPDETRFQGVSGHPNSLGRISSVFAVLIFAVAYRRYVSPVVWVPMLLLAAGTMLATQSRTSLAAVVIAGGLQIPRRYFMPLAGIVGIFILAVFLTGQANMFLSLIGRDGDVSEAASMSGRTDVWSFAWGLIINRPFTGYGFNSYETYAGTLWVGAAASTVATHNNYVSVLYCTGIIGAVPFFFAFAVLLYRWLFQPDAPRDFFVLNTIFNGFAESDVLSTISVIPTFIFLLFIAIDAQKRLAGFSDAIALSRV